MKHGKKYTDSRKLVDLSLIHISPPEVIANFFTTAPPGRHTD